MKQSRIWLALFIATLALGVFLRTQGLSFGDPSSGCRPDEEFVVREAVYVMSGDQVRFFQYPPALIYMLSGWFEIATAMDLLPTDPQVAYTINPMPYHLAARWFSVILGSATLLLVGLTARKLADWRMATIATLVIATSPLHNLHSHFATVDVPGTFFVTLSLFFALTATPGALWPLLASALAGGVAAGTKYPLGVVSVIPLFMAFQNPRRLRALLAVSCLTLLGLLVAAPTWVFEFTHAWQGLLAEARSQTERRSLVSLESIVSLHWRLSLVGGFGVFNIGFALIGLTYAAYQKTRLGVLLILAALICLINFFIGVPFVRYFVPLTPVIALGVASLPYALKGKQRTWILLALLVAQWPMLRQSLATGRMLQVTDTRAQLLTAFEDGTLPRNLTIVRPDWPFDVFPLAHEVRLQMAFEHQDQNKDARAKFMAAVAKKLEHHLDLLRVVVFDKEQQSTNRLQELLLKGDFLYIEPQTPEFTSAWLTFQFQRHDVTPMLRSAAASGKIKMTELLDLDPRKNGKFPDSSHYGGFDYWFIPMKNPSLIERPGPRIRVFRISSAQ